MSLEALRDFRLIETARLRVKEEEALRQRGVEDFYFFTKAILGAEEGGELKTQDLSPGLHYDLCRWLQNSQAKKRGVRLPRGHFKTTVCSLAYSIWRIVRNPNIRIFLCNASAPNSKKWVTAIEQVFEQNGLFQRLYPHLVPLAKSSAEAMLVPREKKYSEATIEAGGVDTRLTSNHYDLIICDDLVGEQAYKSRAEMEWAIEFYKLLRPLLNNPTESEILMPCTRWTPDDLVNYVMKTDKNFEWFSKKAIENGQPIFPERFSMDGLDDIRRTIGNLFFSQYMDDPAATESGDFKAEWLRNFSFYRRPKKTAFIYVNQEPPKETCLRLYEPDGSVLTETVKTYELGHGGEKLKTQEVVVLVRDLYVVGGYDPAISTGDDSSYTAMVILGGDSSGRTFLLDSFRKRVSPDEALKAWTELVRNWKPSRFSFEKVAFQAILEPLLNKIKVKEGFAVEVVPVTRGGESKFDRIDALQPVFKAGTFYVSPLRASDWMDEYKHYSAMAKVKKRGVHFDLLDATRDAHDLIKPAYAEQESGAYEERLEGMKKAQSALCSTGAV